MLSWMRNALAKWLGFHLLSDELTLLRAQVRRDVAGIDRRLSQLEELH